jgi:hypothetical protein
VLFSLLLGCGGRHVQLPGVERPIVQVQAGPGDFRLNIIDDHDSKRFRIELLSLTDEWLCIDQYGWPDSWGRLHFAGRLVHVAIGESVFPIRDYNMGYPGGEFRIPPGGKLKGFISFAEFDAELAADPEAERELIFRPVPYVCDP